VTYESSQIQYAVASICPEIKLRLDNNSNAVSERALWWELSSCVLSSRVPYELATVAADALDHTRVLLDHRGHDRLEERIFDILSKPLSVKGRMRKYRFPAAKAAQLALTHQRIHSEATGLSKLIAGFEVAEDAGNGSWITRQA
jgi:N-glycosylase/DNA lyase